MFNHYANMPIILTLTITTTMTMTTTTTLKKKKKTKEDMQMIIFLNSHLFVSFVVFLSVVVVIVEV